MHVDLFRLINLSRLLGDFVRNAIQLAIYLELVEPVSKLVRYTAVVAAVHVSVWTRIFVAEVA